MAGGARAEWCYHRELAAITTRRGATVHHIVIFQNGKLAENPTLELAEQVKGQPGSLVWLDLEGGLGRAGSTLTKLFGISKFTLDNVREEHERARLSKRHGYFYLVVHGMSFDMQTLEAGDTKARRALLTRSSGT